MSMKPGKHRTFANQLGMGRLFGSARAARVSGQVPNGVQNSKVAPEAVDAERPGVSTCSSGVRGSIDIISSERIAGWILSKNQQAEKVSIYHNSKLIGTGPAITTRQDLIDSNMGSGEFGFSIAFESKIHLRRGDVFRVVPSDSIGEYLQREITREDVNLIECNIDKADGRGIAGWIRHPFLPDRRVKVILEINGRVISQGICNLPRGDLAALGYGDGRYGFTFNTEESIRLESGRDEHQVLIRNAETKRVLTTFTISEWRTSATAFKRLIKDADLSLLNFSQLSNTLPTVGEGYIDKAFAAEAVELRNRIFHFDRISEHFLARNLEYFIGPRHLRTTAASCCSELLEIARIFWSSSAYEVKFSREMLACCNDTSRQRLLGVYPVSNLLLAYRDRFRSDFKLDDPRQCKNLLYDFIVDTVIRWRMDSKVITHAMISIMTKVEPMEHFNYELPLIYKMIYDNNRECQDRYDMKNRIDRSLFFLECFVQLEPTGLNEYLSEETSVEGARGLVQADPAESGLTLPANFVTNRHSRQAASPQDRKERLKAIFSGKNLTLKDLHICVWTADAGKVTGLGKNVRNTLKALGEMGISHQNCAYAESEPQAYADKILINLFHIQPDDLPLYMMRMDRGTINRGVNIGFFMWEALAPTLSQHMAMELVDEIWTATEFTKLAFSKICNIPIRKVSHAVEPSPPSKRNYRRDFGMEGEFVFLFSFDVHSCTERKNPGDVIRAFRSEFNNGEKVRLIIKAKSLGSAIGMSTNNGLAEEIFEYAERDSRITLVTEVLSESDYSALICTCDCYISLHRSEGFGYTLAEAMYFNKPVIATAYSGSEDFCRADTCALVEVEAEIPIKHLQFVAPVPGGVWAQPSLVAAQRRMRAVFSDSAYRKGLAENGRKLMLAAHGIKRLSENYTRALQQLLEGSRSRPGA